jgi:hypothetical protein
MFCVLEVESAELDVGVVVSHRTPFIHDLTRPHYSQFKFSLSCPFRLFPSILRIPILPPLSLFIVSLPNSILMHACRLGYYPLVVRFWYH